MVLHVRTFSDEEVNAYVDGELPAHDAAALVRQMSHDQDLAERVAMLTRLKSELRALDPAPGGCPPDAAALWPQTAPAARRARAAWPVLRAAAAAIVMLLIAGGLWAFVQGPLARNGDVSGDLVAAAVARHLDWVRGPAGDGGDGRSLTLASFARNNAGVYVPDLGASGLSVVGAEEFGADGVRVGYVGVHDCRLSLFILPDPGAVLAPLRARDADGARAFVWSTPGLDYVLVAAGMDPGRLDLISKAVFEATRALQPFGAETKLALDRNHRQARPCSFG